MDIFKLSTNENSEVYGLSESNYLEKTKKSQPFFNSHEDKYYAICPDCNNPIIIISLFNDRKIDDGKISPRLHGRHYKKTVEGVAEYCQEAYDDCDLKNINSSELKTRRKSKKKTNEIVSLMKQYHPIIRKNIQQIMGVNISHRSFVNLIKVFIGAEGYYYRRVTKWNLPYSFLYMQEQIDLFGKYVNSSENGVELKSVIDNSMYFELRGNQILVKKEGEFARIYFYITNHIILNDTHDEYMDLVVEESYKEQANILINKRIKIDKLEFVRQINELEEVRLCFPGEL